MWGKNQENQIQKPAAKNLYKDEEITKSNDLNDLLESYDVNKITEEQYEKLRFLNNLNNVVNENEEKDSDNEDNNNDNKNDEKNESKIIIGENIDVKKGNNQTIKEIDSDNDEDYSSEFKEIELMRIELEKSLGLKLFKAAYHYVDDATDKKENKYDKDKVEEKIKNDFGNKGFTQDDIESAIEKIPEIFDVILKERIIDQ
jgi:hypothetical protein